MHSYRKYSILLVIFLASGCAVVPAPDDEDVAPQRVSEAPEVTVSSLDAAKQALAENDLDAAELQLQRLLTEQPELGLAWYNLASVYYQKKAWQSANDALMKALQFEPKVARNHHLFGLVAQAQGKISQARGHYLKAIEFEHDYANAHYNLALLNDIYYQDIASAVEHYQHYLALVNDDEETVVWVQELKAVLANAR